MKYSLGAGTLLAGLAGGWLLLAEVQHPVRAESAEVVTPSSSAVLDGMTFTGAMGLQDQPPNVNDTFVFANGTFVSTECRARCEYPARPYFIRAVGDAVEFVSETRCPYKDAKIVWRGAVEGDTVKGTATWTMARWYWTIEKEFWFEGTLAESDVPVASR